MLVLMLMSMLMSHTSVDFFVLSFVLPRAYAYVISENQAIMSTCNFNYTKPFCFKCGPIVTHKIELQFRILVFFSVVDA